MPAGCTGRRGLLRGSVGAAPAPTPGFARALRAAHAIRAEEGPKELDPKALFRRFIAAYAAKDLAAVAEIFAPDIHLQDWNLAVQGREAALAETAKNFAGAESLSIEILSLYAEGPTAMGELHIRVNGQDLFVIDLFTFDGEGRMVRSRAYKG